jgi:hypothetical protein
VLQNLICLVKFVHSWRCFMKGIEISNVIYNLIFANKFDRC